MRRLQLGEEGSSRVAVGEIEGLKPKARPTVEFGQASLLDGRVIVWGEAVDPDNLDPSRQQRAAEMKADEVGGSGLQHVVDSSHHRQPRSRGASAASCVFRHSRQRRVIGRWEEAQ